MDMVGGGKGSAEAQERFHTPPVTYVVPDNGVYMLQMILYTSCELFKLQKQTVYISICNKPPCSSTQPQPLTWTESELL